jgi:hypothetical protein
MLPLIRAAHAMIEERIGNLQVKSPLSKIEPGRKDVARASSRQYSFGKVAAIFLIVGPPTSGLLFYLAVSIANRNADTLYTKIGEAFGIVFSLYGLFASYVAGLAPSLMAGFMYSRSYRREATARHRFLVAVSIGAAAYLLACSLVLYFLYAGRIETDAWPFTAYAAGAGALSALLCALIAEICFKIDASH